MPGIQTQFFASANGGIWRGDQDKTNLTLIVAAQAADDFSSRMRLPGTHCHAPRQPRLWRNAARWAIASFLKIAGDHPQGQARRVLHRRLPIEDASKSDNPPVDLTPLNPFPWSIRREGAEN
ncbi:hypothetical protein J2W42_004070 [Rhizobium tibeticum]|nr:hypothetical protein [Rhizobium tibeticum]